MCGSTFVFKKWTCSETMQFPCFLLTTVALIRAEPFGLCKSKQRDEFSLPTELSDITIEDRCQ